jgi:iron complex outermembrane receptor protein
MISSHRIRLGLLLTASASCLSFAQAYAQTKPAAEAAASDNALEAIVVTAQRRSENLQDVPVAITSVSGKALEASNFQSVTDLQYVVPGVQFDATNGAAFQIRGVGSTSFDYSNEKSVSPVVDDVVMDAQRDNGLTGL